MKNLTVGMAIALGVGAALGVALNNITLWVAIGAGVGAAIGSAVAIRPDNENNEE